MKYIGWIFIFILLWSDCISAQVPDEGYYEIYVNTPSVTSSGSAKDGSGNAQSYAGNNRVVFQRGDWGGGFDDGDVKYMDAPTAQKFLAREKPEYISFYGYRHGGDWLDDWTYSATSRTYISVFIRIIITR